MSTWKFAGYPPVEIDDTGLGRRDAMNKAFAKASGTPMVTNEDLGRREMIQMDPTKAYDAGFAQESYAELRSRSRYDFD